MRPIPRQAQECAAARNMRVSLPKNLFQPGNKIGRLSRRPPDIARRLCQELMLSNFWEIYDLLWKAMRTSLEKGDISVYRYIAEHGFGKLATPLKVQGDPERPIRVVFAAQRPSWLPAEPSALPVSTESVKHQEDSEQPSSDDLAT